MLLFRNTRPELSHREGLALKLYKYHEDGNSDFKAEVTAHRLLRDSRNVLKLLEWGTVIDKVPFQLPNGGLLSRYHYTITPYQNEGNVASFLMKATYNNNGGQLLRLPKPV